MKCHETNQYLLCARGKLKNHNWQSGVRELGWRFLWGTDDDNDDEGSVVLHQIV